MQNGIKGKRSILDKLIAAFYESFESEKQTQRVIFLNEYVVFANKFCIFKTMKKLVKTCWISLLDINEW